MKKYKIGILGAGHIAEKMAWTLQRMEAAEAFAVGSRSREKAERFARAYGLQRAYGSYEALVEDPEVDLVYIATPHSHHYAHALLCLQHKKPVLCEKAFTANARQAEEGVEIGLRVPCHSQVLLSAGCPAPPRPGP